MGNKKKGKEVPMYIVEMITKARMSAGNSWEYYVKWAGYDSEDDSWEPADNVQQCSRILKGFWRHVGVHEGVYPPGYLVEATSEWINKMRRYFDERCDAHLTAALLQRKRDELKEQRSEKQALKRQASVTTVAESSTESHIVKRKRKRRVVVSSDDESYNQSDTVVGLEGRAASVDGSFSLQPHPGELPRKIFRTGSSSVTPGTTTPRKGKEKMRSPSPQSNTHSPSNSLFSAVPSPEAPASLSSSSSSSSSPRVSVPPQPGPSSKASTYHDRRKKPRVMYEPVLIGPGQGSMLPTKRRLMHAPGPFESPRPPSPIYYTPDTLSGPDFNTETPMASVNYTEELAFTEHRQDLVEDHEDAFEGFNGGLPVPAEKSPAGEYDLATADSYTNSIVQPEAWERDFVRTAEASSSAVDATKIRIRRKWMWCGELFINVDENNEERLCGIVITDATEFPGQDIILTRLFGSRNSLRFRKLRDCSDLDRILPACEPPLQMARLGPQDNKDDLALKSLSEYMKFKEKFVYEPLVSDDVFTGILLVFSSSSSLCHLFRVPGDLKQESDLLTAILPWITTVHQQKQEWRLPPTEMASACDILDDQRAVDAVQPDQRGGDHSLFGLEPGRRGLLRNNPTYCRALSVMKFPKAFHQSVSKRSYFIWNSGADGNPNESYLETIWLSSILTQWKAKNVELKAEAEVEVIFVHVGAIVSLHRFPAIVEKRGRRSDIQFFTYGTHETVPPERWGIREIYPLGGIVTFTPNAIIEDPKGAYDMLKELSSHQRWDCYLLPAVIGMVSKVTCGDQDPLSMLKEEKFVLEWAGKHHRMVGMQMDELLEECIKEFNELVLDEPEPEWMGAIAKEISMDLALMQMQPVIMDTFRRFVVIKGSEEDHVVWNENGSEWCTLAEFDFKDRI